MLLAHNLGRSVRSVGGWSCSCRHGDSRLFVLSFAPGGILHHSNCVCVCVWLIQFWFYHLVGIAPPPPPTAHDVEYIQCGFRVFKFRILGCGCEMVNSVWILSPSRYCTTTTTTTTTININTRCGISIYLYFNRAVHPRLYIYFYRSVV